MILFILLYKDQKPHANQIKDIYGTNVAKKAKKLTALGMPTMSKITPITTNN